jgi:hypothetical protein
MVVKAVQAAGQNNNDLTLTEQDAAKLAGTPEGASLLRNGRVVIVVDSAAAGIQGKAPQADDDRLAALDRR